MEARARVRTPSHSRSRDSSSYFRCAGARSSGLAGDSRDWLNNAMTQALIWLVVFGKVKKCEKDILISKTCDVDGESALSASTCRVFFIERRANDVMRADNEGVCIPLFEV